MLELNLELYGPFNYNKVENLCLVCPCIFSFIKIITFFKGDFWGVGADYVTNFLILQICA